MRKFLILLTGMALLMLSGCTQSNIVQPTAETKVADPDFDIKDDVTIDWQQVSLDAEEMFEDKGDYPYSDNFSFRLEPNGKKIFLLWVVSDDFPDGEIQNYMENLIRGFNDVVATQDFSIERSSSDSNGGLWKTYALSYGIAPASTQEDQDTWFISGSYPAGEDFILPDVSAAIDQANQMEQEGGSEESGGVPAAESAEEEPAGTEETDAEKGEPFDTEESNAGEAQ